MWVLISITGLAVGLIVHTQLEKLKLPTEWRSDSISVAEEPEGLDWIDEFLSLHGKIPFSILILNSVSELTVSSNE